MNFKSFFKTIAIVIVIATTIPTTTAAADKALTDSLADVRLLNTITNRVAVIQSMDKAQLTTSDKKALKKELQEMKKSAGDLNSRVYLSVGAIIIIILLLILIL